MNIVQDANLMGFVIKSYPYPPKITELEADLVAYGWRRGMLYSSRFGYILLGLRYGGDVRDADLRLEVRPLDWLPHNPASPYRNSFIYIVRKHKTAAEQLEDDELLVINDIDDDELYIVSPIDLKPLGTVATEQRLTLLSKGGWFHQHISHPLQH